MNLPDCIFCRILTGDAEASVIYRDALCTAFMDIQPVNDGHTLVIPNRHFAELADATPAEWAAVAETGRGVAAALRTADVPCDGVNLFLADSEAAGQEVFHAHLHVIPRFAGDGFGLRFPESYRDLPERSALEEIASKLRTALRALETGTH